ncbi:MAG: hypothetical protein ACI8PT_002670 [Gammaproteobacteria bacterium]|jgi:hypothetical protein
MNYPLALVLCVAMVCGTVATFDNANSQSYQGNYQGVASAPGIGAGNRVHLVDNASGRVALCAATTQGKPYQCTEWSDPPR